MEKLIMKKLEMQSFSLLALLIIGSRGFSIGESVNKFHGELKISETSQPQLQQPQQQTQQQQQQQQQERQRQETHQQHLQRQQQGTKYPREEERDVAVAVGMMTSVVEERNSTSTKDTQTQRQQSARRNGTTPSLMADLPTTVKSMEGTLTQSTHNETRNASRNVIAESVNRIFPNRTSSLDARYNSSSPGVLSMGGHAEVQSEGVAEAIIAQHEGSTSTLGSKGMRGSKSTHGLTGTNKSWSTKKPTSGQRLAGVGGSVSAEWSEAAEDATSLPTWVVRVNGSYQVGGKSTVDAHASVGDAAVKGTRTTTRSNSIQNEPSRFSTNPRTEARTTSTRANSLQNRTHHKSSDNASMDLKHRNEDDDGKFSTTSWRVESINSLDFKVPKSNHAESTHSGSASQFFIEGNSTSVWETQDTNGTVDPAPTDESKGQTKVQIAASNSMQVLKKLKDSFQLATVHNASAFKTHSIISSTKTSSLEADRGNKQMDSVSDENLRPFSTEGGVSTLPNTTTTTSAQTTNGRHVGSELPSHMTTKGIPIDYEDVQNEIIELSSENGASEYRIPRVYISHIPETSTEPKETIASKEPHAGTRQWQTTDAWRYPDSNLRSEDLTTNEGEYLISKLERFPDVGEDSADLSTYPSHFQPNKEDLKETSAVYSTYPSHSQPNKEDLKETSAVYSTYPSHFQPNKEDLKETSAVYSTYPSHSQPNKEDLKETSAVYSTYPSHFQPNKEDLKETSAVYSTYPSHFQPNKEDLKETSADLSTYPSHFQPNKEDLKETSAVYSTYPSHSQPNKEDLKETSAVYSTYPSHFQPNKEDLKETSAVYSTYPSHFQPNKEDLKETSTIYSTYPSHFQANNKNSNEINRVTSEKSKTSLPFEADTSDEGIEPVNDDVPLTPYNENLSEQQKSQSVSTEPSPSILNGINNFAPNVEIKHQDKHAVESQSFFPTQQPPKTGKDSIQLLSMRQVNPSHTHQQAVSLSMQTYSVVDSSSPVNPTSSLTSQTRPEFRSSQLSLSMLPTKYIASVPNSVGSILMDSELNPNDKDQQAAVVDTYTVPMPSSHTEMDADAYNFIDDDINKQKTTTTKTTPYDVYIERETLSTFHPKDTTLQLRQDASEQPETTEQNRIFNLKSRSNLSLRGRQYQPHIYRDLSRNYRYAFPYYSLLPRKNRPSDDTRKAGKPSADIPTGSEIPTTTDERNLHGNSPFKQQTILGNATRNHSSNPYPKPVPYSALHSIPRPRNRYSNRRLKQESEKYPSHYTTQYPDDPKPGRRPRTSIRPSTSAPSEWPDRVLGLKLAISHSRLKSHYVKNDRYGDKTNVPLYQNNPSNQLNTNQYDQVNNDRYEDNTKVPVYQNYPSNQLETNQYDQVNNDRYEDKTNVPLYQNYPSNQLNTNQYDQVKNDRHEDKTNVPLYQNDPSNQLNTNQYDQVKNDRYEDNTNVPVYQNDPSNQLNTRQYDQVKNDRYEDNTNVPLYQNDPTNQLNRNQYDQVNNDRYEDNTNVPLYRNDPSNQLETNQYDQVNNDRYEDNINVPLYQNNPSNQLNTRQYDQVKNDRYEDNTNAPVYQNNPTNQLETNQYDQVNNDRYEDNTNAPVYQNDPSNQLNTRRSDQQFLSASTTKSVGGKDLARWSREGPSVDYSPSNQRLNDEVYSANRRNNERGSEKEDGTLNMGETFIAGLSYANSKPRKSLLNSYTATDGKGESVKNFLLANAEPKSTRAAVYAGLGSYLPFEQDSPSELHSDHTSYTGGDDYYSMKELPVSEESTQTPGVPGRHMLSEEIKDSKNTQISEEILSTSFPDAVAKENINDVGDAYINSEQEMSMAMDENSNEKETWKMTSDVSDTKTINSDDANNDDIAMGTMSANYEFESSLGDSPLQEDDIISSVSLQTNTETRPTSISPQPIANTDISSSMNDARPTITKKSTKVQRQAVQDQTVEKPPSINAREAILGRRTLHSLDPQNRRQQRTLYSTLKQNIIPNPHPQSRDVRQVVGLPNPELSKSTPEPLAQIQGFHPNGNNSPREKTPEKLAQRQGYHGNGNNSPIQNTPENLAQRQGFHENGNNSPREITPKPLAQRHGYHGNRNNSPRQKTREKLAQRQGYHGNGNNSPRQKTTEPLAQRQGYHGNGRQSPRQKTGAGNERQQTRGLGRTSPYLPRSSDVEQRLQSRQSYSTVYNDIDNNDNSGSNTNNDFYNYNENNGYVQTGFDQPRNQRVQLAGLPTRGLYGTGDQRNDTDELSQIPTTTSFDLDPGGYHPSAIVDAYNPYSFPHTHASHHPVRLQPVYPLVNPPYVYVNPYGYPVPVMSPNPYVVHGLPSTYEASPYYEGDSESSLLRSILSGQPTSPDASLRLGVNGSPGYATSRQDAKSRGKERGNTLDQVNPDSKSSPGQRGPATRSSNGHDAEPSQNGNDAQKLSPLREIPARGLLSNRHDKSRQTKSNPFLHQQAADNLKYGNRYNRNSNPSLKAEQLYPSHGWVPMYPPMYITAPLTRSQSYNMKPYPLHWVQNRQLKHQDLDEQDLEAILHFIFSKRGNGWWKGTGSNFKKQKETGGSYETEDRVVTTGSGGHISDMDLKAVEHFIYTHPYFLRKRNKGSRKGYPYSNGLI